MLKKLYEEIGSAPAARAEGAGRASPEPALMPAAARQLARQSGDRDIPLAHAAQQAGLREGNLAHRDRSRPAPASTTRSAIPSASSRPTIPRWSMRSSGARRAGGFPDRRAHLARGADRRRVAVARARHAVPAFLLHHRRRAAAEGEGARGRRGSGRRCRDARRARRDREISRHPARSGSLHRGARSAAAAALFDLVVAEDRSRPRGAHRRYRALRDRRPRRGSASPRRSSPSASTPGAPLQGLCAEGACFRPARRSGDADHHDRPRHRRRAVPRLPARAHGDQGDRAATGCSSAISAATAISSTRTSSPA